MLCIFSYQFAAATCALSCPRLPSPPHCLLTSLFSRVLPPFTLLPFFSFLLSPLTKSFPSFFYHLCCVFEKGSFFKVSDIHCTGAFVNRYRTQSTERKAENFNHFSTDESLSVTLRSGKLISCCTLGL